MRARLRQLVPEAPSIAAALAVACVVEVGLRTMRLPRLARLIGAPLALDGGHPGSRAELAELPPKARRQVRATRRVLRHWPFGDTCLRQALVSGQRLRRLDPTLCVGVARIDGEIRAHAWLVIGGGILDPLAAAASYQHLAQPSGGLQ